MFGITVRLFVVIGIVISMTTGSAFAQTASAPVGEEKAKTTTGGPRKQLATIVFAGLGGAVLGLSTLSFYGRPQDKLSNIAIGFALGVIAGTSYVTYKAATRPSEFYGDRPTIDIESSRIARGAEEQRPLSLGMRFDF